MTLRMLKSVLAATLAVLMTFVLPHAASACTICYGEPGNPLTEGVSAGVLVLLGVIVAVLAWFGGMIIFFARRASRRVAGKSDAALVDRPAATVS